MFGVKSVLALGEEPLYVNIEFLIARVLQKMELELNAYSEWDKKNENEKRE